MPDIEHFHDVLFELSNEDRFNILEALMIENYNVTNMSKLLSLTTQEASRHLTRLAEAGLIEKNVSGEYELTAYGSLVLSQATGIMFATSNKEYFIDHKTDDLPPEFLCQLTKLRGSRLVTDVMVSFANIDRIINEATEYIWRLTDRYNMMSLPKLEEATERGVMLKLMQTKDFQYPPEWPGSGIVLKEARVKLEEEAVKPRKLTLAGQEFVVTGRLEAFTRQEAEAKIEDLGGTTKDSVTRKTNCVVVGADPGSSKLARAQELGIERIDEKEFLHRVGHTT